MKKSPQKIQYSHSVKLVPALVTLFLFLVLSLIGCIVSSVIWCLLSPSTVLFNSGTNDPQPLNAELAVFIFMVIFGTLVVLSLIVCIIWFCILKFKRHDKVKIPLTSQELNSAQSVVDLEVQDE